jgi:hypothetical protein
MAMYGADADALDALATLLDQRAADLDGIYRRLGRQMYAAPWQGQGADQFRGRWNTVHGRQVSDATGFLRAGARVLHDNARQQRAASDSGTGLGAAAGLVAGGGGGGGGGGGWGDDKSGDAIDDLLKLLKLPSSVIKDTKKLLEQMDPRALAEFEKMLSKHASLVGFLENVGKAAGVATVVLGFVKDVIAHPALPMDERLVHAAIKTGVTQLESVGADQLGSYVGAAVAGMVSGGLAAPVGYVVGKVLGEALGDGVSALDDHFHVSDHIADAGLEAYEYAKTHNVAEMAVDVAEKAVDGAVHGAENLAKGAVHLAESGVKTAEHVISSLNPFD